MRPIESDPLFIAFKRDWESQQETLDLTDAREGMGLAVAFGLTLFGLFWLSIGVCVGMLL